MTISKAFLGVSVATLFIASQSAAVLGLDAKPYVDVVQLRHADAKNVQDVADELVTYLKLSVHFLAADDNKLFLVGNEKDIAEVKQSIIAKLDSAPPPEDATTAVFKLNNKPGGSLLAALQGVARSSHLRIGLDPSSGTFAVSGDKTNVESFKDLIARIDVPRRPVTLDFFFLRGRLGPTGPPVEARLPSALAAVVQPLAKNGFTSLEMLTPIRVVTYEGESFEVNSSLNISGSNEDKEAQEMLMIHVRGIAEAPGPTNTINASINAAVSNPMVKNRPVHFEVQTSLTANPGDYTVLSAAPSSMGDNEALVLVVRATRA